ncbi:hypothetical protein BDB00DRAFT_789225 [Zychaea mexicana]|uniref:uncharacterized protein n=1 Tax=Zychaea mexicana TaxID=64656 RepID=UPI0022FE0032|nr:uncharacterized protein BDB00DRAFT_789225 [Zychaea mexicana]KAI9491913.1 hypothetical protein BDB00DRAFT_789225 [Zychaea mexicana]
MTSPSSSVDMDISDGSDHGSVSNMSDMEVADYDDEISQSPFKVANSSTSMKAQQRQHQQQQIAMQPHELASAAAAAAYTATVSEGLQQSYAYYPQQPVKIPPAPSPNRQIHVNPSKHNTLFDATVTTAATTGNTTASLAAIATAADSDKKIDEDMDKYDDNDSDSLSSFVTAPLYTVNESEEEPGLIRDEDEDDMETLAWYKHQVSKFDTEIETTKKEKRGLEQELLRLQVLLSMEKNKMKSRKKGKMKAQESVTAIKGVVCNCGTSEIVTTNTTANLGLVTPNTPSIASKPINTATQSSAGPVGASSFIPSTAGAQASPRPPSTFTSSQQRLQKHQPVTVSAANISKQLKTSVDVASPTIAKTPALRSLQNQRANAITAHNSESKISINPATKRIVEEHRGSKGAFKAYESPLQRFGFSGTSNINPSSSSGINSNNTNVNGNGATSTSNNDGNGLSVENVNRELCSFETVGGQCNDDTCQALHFRDFNT